MGKAYHMLPQWLVMKCTMNREYWLEKKKAVTDDDDNDASRGADRGFCYHHDIYDAQDTPGKSSDRSCHVLGDHGADLSSICSGSRSCGSLRKVVRHLFHTKLSVPVYDLLLIVKAFGMTIQLSQLESKQRELIQKMALEQKFLEEKRQSWKNGKLR